MLHDKGNFKDVIKVKEFEKGDYPKLSTWVQYNYIILNVENLPSLESQEIHQIRQQKSQRDFKHETDLNSYAGFEENHKPENKGSL